MRTKTLVLSGVVAALTSVSAMAQVYSLNTVGYINVTCPPQAFSLVADQLWANGVGNNQYISPLLDSQLLDGLHNGSAVYVYENGGFVPFTVQSGGWLGANNINTPGTPASTTINPGSGFFIYNSSTNPLVLTFVGTVGQGNQTNSLPQGAISLVSSMWPAAGTLDSSSTGLDFSSVNNDFFAAFQASSGGYVEQTFLGGSWLGGVPTVSVGEAFFYYNAGASANQWVQSFNVQ
jgi:hypothetical protein